eukprot:TRINITY_DN2378_c0_g1_i1.p1 TRINITY_DN2378_c0_g1~~TRINITY_DN2378_c0_g1_i1.p1  ORF type:complete len:500 (-),score=102.80 TRINITY_DN2378_c0_g1_i1:57-1556(-)
MTKQAHFKWCLLLLLCASITAQSTNSYLVDTRNVTAAWTHVFEHCVGSGHAALALRADYQAQLTQTRLELGFEQVRFHGLFVDDMSVALSGGNGVEFSFFNIDRIYDFFLSIGIKPLVEIGFMPNLLASGDTTWSHYDANVTPPKNWTQWTDLITAFATHLIERYGEEEVTSWNFEVWNEPNCCPDFFWTGGQKLYFYLFNVTSHALKAVNPNLKVGGPATAMSSWIPDFISFCDENNVPYDFISTHEYPTDPPGPQTRLFFIEHLKATRALIPSNIPLYYTEYDDGYNSPTSYGAAFAVFQNYMANNVVDALSWWPFSDIFEENGLFPDPFLATPTSFMPVDGLMNVYGIPKPSYRAFQLLHWTGDQLVQTTPDTLYSNNDTVGVFAVAGNNTSIFVVNWNVMNDPISAEDVEVTVLIDNPESLSAVAFYIDQNHTTAYPAWVEMGSPLYLTPKQVAVLNLESELVPQPLALEVNSGSVAFTVTVQPNALVNVILSQQ